MLFMNGLLSFFILLLSLPLFAEGSDSEAIVRRQARRQDVVARLKGTRTMGKRDDPSNPVCSSNFRLSTLYSGSTLSFYRINNVVGVDNSGSQPSIFSLSTGILKVNDLDGQGNVRLAWHGSNNVLYFTANKDSAEDYVTCTVDRNPGTCTGKLRCTAGQYNILGYHTQWGYLSIFQAGTSGYTPSDILVTYV